MLIFVFFFTFTRTSCNYLAPISSLPFLFSLEALIGMWGLRMTLKSVVFGFARTTVPLAAGTDTGLAWLAEGEWTARQELMEVKMR